ncbi:MAG: hypothetical protein JRI23_11965 [Deltaproteobacteria bacterium]|nr:hypothetical protein [Deltaproteobacteria bacterium]MBW2532424.1 hypothetical protein [Deltaproteobacteria bacterium]
MDELIRKTLDGDADSWDRLWARLEPMVWALTGRGRLTGRLSQRRSDREAVRDEVKAHLKAKRFAALRRYVEAADRRSKSSDLKTWLATITTRKALDRAKSDSERRSERPRSKSGRESDGDRRPLRNATPQQVDAAMAMLGRAREALDQDEVAALHLWLQGGRLLEVGEALGLDEAQESARLIRTALGKLRSRRKDASEDRAGADATGGGR